MARAQAPGSARISSMPLPALQDVASLEALVRANPEDLASRVELLGIYSNMAPVPPNDDPVRRLARLQQILYLIDHHPEAAALAMSVCYVPSSRAPYANEADHLAARDHWLSAVDLHPGNARVIVNAVRFLAVEDKNDAEAVLEKAMATDPENSGPDLASHAAAELERTSNPIVLAAAGTALPNLAIGANPARPADPKIFELASSLSTRARQLAPGDRDIQGPMPLIRYFAEARNLEGNGEHGARASAGIGTSRPPVRLRVDGKAQAALLIRQVTPQYPEEARAAGITGEVGMSAVIARDGTVEALELISGPPLLVRAAQEAIQHWVYKPATLNDAPVEVITEIMVNFPGN